MKNKMNSIIILIGVLAVLILSILYIAQSKVNGLLTQEKIDQIFITKEMATYIVTDKDEINYIIGIFNKFKYEKLNDFDEISKYGNGTADYYITGALNNENVFVIGIGKDYIMISEIGKKYSYINKMSESDIELLKSKLDK